MVEKKIVVRTEPHHRRPRSLSGSSKPFNLSYVKKDIHEFWHILYGNLNAYQTCELMNSDLKLLNKSARITCRFINGTEVTKSGKGGTKKIELRKEVLKKFFLNSNSI